MYSHKIPNHLEVEDTFVLGLTIRQCVIIGVGATMAYALFNDLFASIADPVLGLVVGLVAGIVLFSCMLAIALVHLAHRSLDEWMFVVLMYWLHPRMYLWRFNRLDAFERLDMELKVDAVYNDEDAETW